MFDPFSERFWLSAKIGEYNQLSLRISSLDQKQAKEPYMRFSPHTAPRLQTRHVPKQTSDGLYGRISRGPERRWFTLW